MSIFLCNAAVFIVCDHISCGVYSRVVFIQGNTVNEMPSNYPFFRSEQVYKICTPHNFTVFLFPVKSSHLDRVYFSG